MNAIMQIIGIAVFEVILPLSVWFRVTESRKWILENMTFHKGKFQIVDVIFYDC